MVHKLLGNQFVISSGGAWLPGVYETEKAAHYAFQFDNTSLQKLQDRTIGGAITSQMLKDFRNEDLKA